MIPPIAWLVSKGYVSPAFGRMLEVASYTAVSAGVVYATDSLSGGKTLDFHGLENAVIVAFLVYVSKSLRDASATETLSLPVTPAQDAKNQDGQA